MHFAYKDVAEILVWQYINFSVRQIAHASFSGSGTAARFRYFKFK